MFRDSVTWSHAFFRATKFERSPVARRLADVRTYVRLLARPDDFPDAIDAVDARDARARTENYS